MKIVIIKKLSIAALPRTFEMRRLETCTYPILFSIR